MCEQYLWEMRRARTDTEYLEALGQYLICQGEKLKARDAHAAAWDERLYQMHKAVEEAWDRLIGKIDWPRPPPYGERFAEACEAVFASKETAMIFSERIDRAFEKAGIKLADDQTYACFICVTEKPEYVSDALALDPLRKSRGAGRRVHYVLEPRIMGPVMDALEKDKIQYPDEG